MMPLKVRQEIDRALTRCRASAQVDLKQGRQ